ncbi:hypothetical protein BDU57DRAFT_556668 [Ampelomyces quisqualis]|uniref:Zn(2)-C6 fungal-type domain-containing protein n=1 Tax=Ampelomyces quisqualis TaxID=50730 RepID=A0A6A5QNZ6_AMPQU|nr:hypothetical protein BDU57DRAFT_556668 [Ampelomyces quisqualis]
MVYRGRPSTGCKRCRERKVKCDERPGRCVKCEERKITCPGYDRTAHALFHDETAKVEAKAKLSNARADTVRKKQDGENMALVLSNAAESPKIHLLAPLIDQGISFFMAHHAVGLDQPSITSSEYNRYLSTDGFHPLILTTMTALGIAGVANLYMDPGLKCEATKWYLKAIRMANEAISSPTKVHKDTTLVAVNLLTLFEATFNEDSLSGWSHHVDGASLLIKVRGDDQVHTAAARRLYLHTVGLLTINCMGKEIIDRALELDTAEAAIFENVPRDWRYDTVPCYEKITGVFGHYYHVYHTHSAAQTWNWVRYNRIYFHDIIRNYRIPLVRVSGGYSTVWALYVAGSMPTASAESQDFVLHCFDRIDREFGIKQARVFGHALRLKQRMENSGETPLSLCPRYLPPDPGPDMPYRTSNSKASYTNSTRILESWQEDTLKSNLRIPIEDSGVSSFLTCALEVRNQVSPPKEARVSRAYMLSTRRWAVYNLHSLYMLLLESTLGMGM